MAKLDVVRVYYGYPNMREPVADKLIRWYRGQRHTRRFDRGVMQRRQEGFWFPYGQGDGTENL